MSAFLEWRAAGPELREAARALNNADAEKMSYLDAAALEDLASSAFGAWVEAEGRALLIAFRDGAAYESENFRWFAARRARFVYVDRVVVAASARGRGLARTLYEIVFDAARRDGVPLVCCEVNTTPPNPGSHAFHAALGFEPVGAAAKPDGSKAVRFYEKRLQL